MFGNRREFSLYAALGLAMLASYFVTYRLVQVQTAVEMPRWVPFLPILTLPYVLQVAVSYVLAMLIQGRRCGTRSSRRISWRCWTFAYERPRWLWWLIPAELAGTVGIVTSSQHRPMDVLYGVALAIAAGLVFGVHRRRVTAFGSVYDWKPR